VTSRQLLDVTFNISTFGEDANGEIYLADYNSGTIYKLADDRPLSTKRRAVRK
jgi:hypothetical protein